MKIQAGENLKPRSQYAEEAVQLAVAGDWEEAASLNRFILEQFEPDEQTHNRLGKALSELGQLDKARAQYEACLVINPLNSVARKNAQKLEMLAQTKGGLKGGAARVDLNLFVEEMGKTIVTDLEAVGDPEISTKVAAGDLADLRVDDDGITVVSNRGIRLGSLESKLARRLIKFIQGGNRYAAGVTAADGPRVKVIIRETYQDPKFAGKPSFPVVKKRGLPEFRPYAKESLLSRDVEIFTGEDDDDEVLPAGRGATDDDDLEDGGLHEVEDDAEAVDVSEDAADSNSDDDDEDDE